MLLLLLLLHSVVFCRQYCNIFFLLFLAVSVVGIPPNCNNLISILGNMVFLVYGYLEIVALVIKEHCFILHNKYKNAIISSIYLFYDCINVNYYSV